MDSSGNGDNRDEIQELEMSRTKATLGDFVPISMPTVERGLLDEQHRKKRFLDFLKARPSRDWFLKFGIIGRLSPFTFFRRNASPMDGSSPPPPPDTSRVGGPRRFRVPFVRKINWKALAKHFKKWLINPKNMALFIWLIACLICILLLLLLMIGALNGLIEKSSERKRWTEIVNQILNALFTTICLYYQPYWFYHLFLLYRWRSKDQAELRKVYCKNGIGRPHERAHITFVVVLLHITCFSQYVLCGLYWGYNRKNRPDLGEMLGFSVAAVASVIAAVYIVFGPLGKKYEAGTDEESQRQEAVPNAIQLNQLELKATNRRVIVTRPEWIGGLFDCWDDMTVAYLSFFCTFCVFGWNVERLGFGNMYVHIVTFILLCIAPFLVFNAAALKINEDVVKYSVGITGIVLCGFGLLYGGFWRIQMRKKFKLPANPFCCGYPALTDCMQWLFCCSCSLAQEVRTANFYDIEEDSFYTTHSGDGNQSDETSRPVLLPLAREGGFGPFFITSDLDSPIRSYSCPPKIGLTNGFMVTVEEARSRSCRDNIMTPPVPLLIQIEDNQPPQT